MLQVNKAPPSTDREAILPSAKQSFAAFIALLRRRYAVIVLTIGCMAALGVTYLLTTPPSFTAAGTMVIDSRKVQLFQQQSVLGDIAVDAGTVNTQVEILRSQNLSLAVIKDLKLTEDPEFVGNGSGFIGALTTAIAGLLRGSEERSEFELTRRALTSFEDRRTIARVGPTYAIEIGFRSLDPAKSARIANAIADAYVVDQLEAKYQATRRASAWLQDRIKELRTQASAAERAVVDFKDRNKIVNTGGRLMNEQQLAEVNSQLNLARAATAESKARLSRIQEIMRQDVPDASVTDSLKSEVIIKLRQQYLDLSSREAIWSARYGVYHLAAINLRNQMQEIRRNILDEMKKIAESYKSDFEIARTREESIKRSLDSAVSESQVTNQAQVQLRELESNAQTYRTIYDNFLQRYMEAVQQQSFPITEARLISPAVRPLYKSNPSTILVLLASIGIGIALSGGIVAWRELSDNVFRTSAQVEDLLQVNCLAVLPAMRVANKARAAPAVAPSHTEATSFSSLQGLPRDIAPADPMLRYVVDAPFSRFTEALRSLKVSADLNNIIKANRVIGVTSTLPNEGKSTTAANFAQLIAHSGSSVLLIDADLRNPSLSRAWAPNATTGLTHVVGSRDVLQQSIWSDPETKLSFLPAGRTSKLLHTNEVLASDAMRALIEDLRRDYDYIIVDFPPLAPVVDTRTTTHFIDSYVYVVEWGRTSIEVVQQGLVEAREVYDRLLGAVLNKADTKVIGRYDHYRGRSYQKYYSRYGYVD